MRMSPDEASDRFAQSPVARLATVGAAGRPHLVPVTFAVVAAGASARTELIVFAVDHKPKTTTSLRRLDNIAANPKVCFLVDHYDGDWDRLWWVRADARASVLEDGDRRRALAALIAKYPQYRQVRPAGVVVGSTVERWTGWRAAGG